MLYVYQHAGRWAAIIAVLGLVSGLTACAQWSSSEVAEGSSSPPPSGSVYVYPPPNLQVYD